MKGRGKRRQREGHGKKVQGGGEKEERIWEVKMINSQGLTQAKYMELEREIKKETLMCIVETQKVEDIIIAGDIKAISSMRGVDDRRGGGLMMMYQEEDCFYLEKVPSESTEILHAEGKMGEMRMTMLLVYLRTVNEVEVGAGNRRILREVEEKIRRRKADIGVLVLGDFNGHLGYLGHQKENRNGKLVNDFIDEMDMCLLNIEEECKGRYTWERGKERSVINLVMTDREARRRFVAMEIDEERERFDLSDHEGSGLT